ncbi:MAG: tetratricopeptide repeat protein [Burkholderiaceae bacterium]
MSRRLTRVLRACSLALVFASVLGAPYLACAAPVVPSTDEEVVEHLPARLNGVRRLIAEGQSREARDPANAVVRAHTLLDEARDRGDPRYAGYALAAIAPWKNDPAAPPPITILQATLAQYQHDFDGSRRMLEAVLQRDPGNPQAMLTLATIARVQGRYADSDRLCAGVRARLYEGACLAENRALRGQFDAARISLRGLLVMSSRAGRESLDVQRWLTTTLAELEERAGDDAAADAAFLSALGMGRDSYLALDYADFLLAHDRFKEADQLLVKEPMPYGDGVLLRLAIARRKMGSADAKALADEMRERFDAARERGDAISIHGRELARQLFALEGDAQKAVVVARENLRIQKEPADFVVMAEAARAADDRAALREVEGAASSIGLVDTRLAKIIGSGGAR